MDTIRYITDDLSDVDTQELLKCLPNYFEPLGEGPKGVAFLNWRIDKHTALEEQFFNLGDGYFQAAVNLIDSCLKDGSSNSADILIFPIMFCTIHGIEVYLKGFNSQYKIYHGLQAGESVESKIDVTHNIRRLCEVAISLVKDKGDKDLKRELLFVKKFVDILYANTDDMTFARYSTDSKKQPHFYVQNDGNVTIDLYVLRQWIIRMSTILDNCTSFISWHIDEIMEWLYESSIY